LSFIKILHDEEEFNEAQFQHLSYKIESNKNRLTACCREHLNALHFILKILAAKIKCKCSFPDADNP